MMDKEDRQVFVDIANDLHRIRVALEEFLERYQRPNLCPGCGSNNPDIHSMDCKWIDNQ